MRLLDLETNNVYNTRSKNKLKHKFSRTGLKSMCISVTGVKLYNKLLDDVKNCKNVKLFVKKCKSKMINSYANVPH